MLSSKYLYAFLFFATKLPTKGIILDLYRLYISLTNGEVGVLNYKQ